MTIVFEPWRDGSGRSLLPVRGTGRETRDSGFAALSLITSGRGTQGNLGTGRATLPLQALGLSEVGGVGQGRMEFTVYGDDVPGGVPVPDIALGSAVFVLGTAGAGTQENHGTGHAVLPMAAWGSDLSAVGRAALPLDAWGSDPGTGGSSRTAILLQPTQFFASMTPGDTIQVRDAVGMLAEVWTHWSFDRRETLGMHVSAMCLLDGLATLSDTLAWADVTGIVWQMLVNEGLALGDQADAWAEALLHMVDALALTAGTGSLLDARTTVAQTLTMMDASALAWPSSISEVLAMAETATHGLHGAQTLLEVLSLHAVADGHADMVALVDEGLALSDATGSTADLVARIREGAEVLATFHLPGDTTYTAWVLHGAARAYTQYRNFPFNSFCELDGRYFGASDTGLYELTGDDDAGTPIDAHIRSGLDDLGTGKLKRVPSMYLGYRADGEMVMKVITTSEDGAKREDWYAVQPRPADAMREGRVKLGRGLKSRYWGFELSNVDGADFEIDTIAWLPMVLERRV